MAITFASAPSTHSPQMPEVLAGSGGACCCFCSSLAVWMVRQCESESGEDRRWLRTRAGRGGSREKEHDGVRIGGGTRGGKEGGSGRHARNPFLELGQLLRPARVPLHVVLVERLRHFVDFCMPTTLDLERLPARTLGTHLPPAVLSLTCSTALFASSKASSVSTSVSWAPESVRVIE